MRHLKLIAAAAATAAAALLGVAGAAFAAGAAAPAPTTVTVTPVTTLKAGDTSPFDVAGVKAIRKGKAIPSGYVLPGYKVETHRGTKVAGAALRVVCPDGKRLRSFGTTGQAGFLAPTPYVGKRSTVIVSLPSGSKVDTSGTIYAVYR